VFAQAAVHSLGARRAETAAQMRSLLLLSAGGHILLVIALGLAPPPAPLRMPPVLTVDLVAALPPAPAPEAPAPAPVPAPAPAPKPKVKILPKKAPPAVVKPKAKAKPKPKPEPVLRRRERPKELKYEDALAKLRGEVDAAPLLAAPAPAAAEAPAASSGRPTQGLRVSPELLAWHRAVKQHVRRAWIMPPKFRDSGLAAELVIDVAADGTVLGQPELVASSGNPFYDDNAVRALVKASPLPAPPKAGRRTIVFTPEE